MIRKRIRSKIRSRLRTNRHPGFSLTVPHVAGDNNCMSTETAATDPLAESEHTDTRAVLRHAFEQAPLDPEVARRVDERADRITEQVRRTRGVIDDETFQTLLADDES
jgi:hypothetical protein